MTFVEHGCLGETRTNQAHFDLPRKKLKPQQFCEASERILCGGVHVGRINKDLPNNENAGHQSLTYKEGGDDATKLTESVWDSHGQFKLL